MIGQANFKCIFRVIFTILFLTFLASCAGSGDKNMKELLSNDDEGDNADDNLLSEENLTEDSFAESEGDDVMAAEDSLDEKAEGNFNLENNLDEKIEKDDALLSLENPSDLNNVEIKKLDDFVPSEEEAPLVLEKKEDLNEEEAPLVLEKKEDLNGRVVRYVKVDCDVYDASKNKVIGSFKKGEPVVVAIGSDGWGMLSEAHFIKVENLSVKGVGRVRR